MATTINGTTGINRVEPTAYGLPLSFRNKIINGNFDFWQRGASTTFTSGGGSYVGADRFLASFDGTIGSATISRLEFSVGGYPNTKYFLQWSQSVAGSGSTVRTIGQKIESVWTLSGQTATLSFLAWADSPRTIVPQFIQIFGGGGSPSSPVTTTGTAINLTTTPTRYTQTIEIPSISGKAVGSDGTDCLWVRLLLPTNTAMTVNIAQIQLEEGSVATPFEHRPYGTELALCQRYYWQGGQQTVRLFSNGINDVMCVPSTFPVTMRASPTCTYVLNSSGNVNLLDIIDASASGFSWRLTGATQGQAEVRANPRANAEL